MPEKLLSANDLADILGVTVRTIYDHAKDGLIPSYAVGRSRRFKLEEVLSAYRTGGPKPSTRRKDVSKNSKARYQSFDWSSGSR